MTLILSAHKRDAVVQASDRLVSQITVGRGLRPLDVVANKSVVYLASDAIVAIAFSGRAFLKNRRTDLWLTEVLTGMEFEEGGSIVFFVGGHGPTDVWHACQRVREEAERAFRPLRRASYRALFRVQWLAAAAQGGSSAVPLATRELASGSRSVSDVQPSSPRQGLVGLDDVHSHRELPLRQHG